ncbi:MAG: hypothetical protein BMS9Abin28_0110 [Anaerolineae bacterium]|nr:MAG: hypothetical protein BMS9Abin28_0110 [Anaerolineae bacterium]
MRWRGSTLGNSHSPLSAVQQVEPLHKGKLETNEVRAMHRPSWCLATASLITAMFWPDGHHAASVPS